jgi:hypothetical protein
MAIHTIIEINHDLSHKWKQEPEKFIHDLYHCLAGTSLQKNVENFLRIKYGIKILNQHHSSEEFKVVKDS